MESNPLVSIIVPIYNTETFLGECIESIIAQKYRNIEIILVDDGSTDDSLALCKRFSRSDERIVILEQQNSGVSDARNLGIEKSKGKYVTFVDSDDIIADDLVSNLLDAMTSTASDVSVCKIGTYLNSKPVNDGSINEKKVVLNRQQAVEALLYQRNMKNSVCAKLYKREILHKPYYLENITYGEDLLFNYYALSASNRIVISYDTKYYYRQRPGSAMNSEFMAKMMDSLDVAVIIKKDSMKNNPSYIRASKTKLFTEALTLIQKIPRDRQHYIKERGRCMNIISRYKYAVIFNNDANFAHRSYALLSVLSVRLLRWLLLMKKSLKRYL